MDTSFSLGLAASIPIGFAVNLLTPSIQRFLERREARHSHVIPARVVNELATLREYSKDSQKYEDYRFIQLMRTTIVGTLGGVLTAIFVAIPQFTETLVLSGIDMPYRVKDAVAVGSYIGGGLVTIVTGLIIINIARDSLRIMRWVRRYPEYEQKVRFTSFSFCHTLLHIIFYSFGLTVLIHQLLKISNYP